MLINNTIINNTIYTNTFNHCKALLTEAAAFHCENKRSSNWRPAYFPGDNFYVNSRAVPVDLIL